MIQLLTIILPIMGVRVGSDQLTSAIQTVIVVITGIYIWIRRVQQKDVTALGVRKY